MEIILAAFTGAVFSWGVAFFWSCRRAKRFLLGWIPQAEGGVKSSLRTNRELASAWVKLAASMGPRGPTREHPEVLYHYVNQTDIESFVVNHFLEIRESAARLLIAANSSIRDADHALDELRQYMQMFAKTDFDYEDPAQLTLAVLTAQTVARKHSHVVERLELALKRLAVLRADPWTPLPYS